MKDLPPPQVGFLLVLANNAKTYTFFCKSLVEKQTWMTEIASMVRPNKPADSFIKSASFHPSRPPPQTVANRLSGGPATPNSILVPSFPLLKVACDLSLDVGSVNIGSGKFRSRQQATSSPTTFFDVDATDGAGSDNGYNTPPLCSSNTPPPSWSKLRASNDSDKSTDGDDLSGSPNVSSVVFNI
jgi:hypothetical protein